MRISIVGTGYVGLVSGACLAECGHDVVCVDIDPAKVDMINVGRPTIHELGLPQLLSRHAGKRLRATTDLATAVASTEVTFIAVGTPAAHGRIDLDYVLEAARGIGEALRTKHGYHLVVVKSTVVPGTTDGPVRRQLESSSGLEVGRDFGLGMNPEFLTEGRAVEDFLSPDRIVIGGVDGRSQDMLATVYAGIGGVTTVVTNNTTAECIKYASNAVLATMISFSNEVARLCAAVGGVDVVDVMRGVHESCYFTTREPGRTPVKAGITSFLEAGCGFGGSCLPKDVTALVGQGNDYGLTMPLLASVLEVNRGQPDELMSLIDRHYADLRGVRVTVLGLAFKPDTDDIRESPAFPVVARLKSRGAVVTVYDPVARPVGHPALESVVTASSLRDAVRDADVVVLVTRWGEFRALDVELAALGREPLVVDGRRVLSPGDFRTYEGIGRRMDEQRRRTGT